MRFYADPKRCPCGGSGSVPVANPDEFMPCPFHADPEELAKYRLERAAPAMFDALLLAQLALNLIPRHRISCADEKIRDSYDVAALVSSAIDRARRGT